MDLRHSFRGTQASLYVTFCLFFNTPPGGLRRSSLYDALTNFTTFYTTLHRSKISDSIEPVVPYPPGSLPRTMYTSKSYRSPSSLCSQNLQASSLLPTWGTWQPASLPKSSNMAYSALSSSGFFFFRFTMQRAELDFAQSLLHDSFQSYVMSRSLRIVTDLSIQTILG